MRIRVPSQRVLAATATLLLCLLVLFSSSGGPPEVSISELSLMDGGGTVVVVGVIVDLWSSDSGSTSILLADLETSSTVKVVCSLPGIGPPLAPMIGDEIRASGELEITGGRPTVWTTFDRLSIVRMSMDVISVKILGEHWDLLTEDRFEVRGVVLPNTGGEYRLKDLDDAASIVLSLESSDASRFEERIVVVDATLRMDDTMRLVLDVHSISSSH